MLRCNISICTSIVHCIWGPRSCIYDYIVIIVIAFFIVLYIHYVSSCVHRCQKVMYHYGQKLWKKLLEKCIYQYYNIANYNLREKKTTHRLTSLRQILSRKKKASLYYFIAMHKKEEKRKEKGLAKPLCTQHKTDKSATKTILHVLPLHKVMIKTNKQKCY